VARLSIENMALSRLVLQDATGAQAVATDRPGLVLITCFPFTSAPPGGTLRFVAGARLIVAPA